MRFAVTRIAVAGTHSTGKSTFLTALADDLTAGGLRVGCVADVASKAKDLGLPILRDHVYESTLWIMAECMRQEMEAALRADVVLVDRPVFDALGYLLAALQATGRHVDARRLEELRAIAVAHASYYDWVAVTVLDERVALGDDRDPDRTFRRVAAEKVDGVARGVVTAAKRLTVENAASLRQEAFEFVMSKRVPDPAA